MSFVLLEKRETVLTGERVLKQFRTRHAREKKRPEESEYNVFVPQCNSRL